MSKPDDIASAMSQRLAANALVVKALIGTHPNLGRAKALLRVLLADWQDAQRNQAFEDGSPAEEAQETIEQVTAIAEKLLEPQP